MSVPSGYGHSNRASGSDKGNHDPMPSTADFFQVSVNLDPRLFEVLCEDLLWNASDDSGRFDSEDMTAVLTRDGLSIDYRKSNELRSVSFSAHYTPDALPEPFAEKLSATLAVKDQAKMLLASGVPWETAVPSALSSSGESVDLAEM